MAKTSLPPGFRFHPTDVELTVYYLKRKIMGKRLRCEAISEVDLYKFAPWDLPDKACLQSKDLEWYFFCPRDRKYSSGSRTNRSTGVGYWKATGKDRSVIYNSRTVGMKRTLVFHVGRPPRGDRTDWVMYEYRLEDKELDATGIQQDAYVLCKIFQKSGPGPKIGEQYGAPFNEEEWDDDATTGLASSIPFASSRPPESSNSMLNSVGQQLIAPDDSEVLLSTMLEPVREHAVTHAHDEMASSEIPNDGIFLDQLAELLNYSPPHLFNATNLDDLVLPDLPTQYENDNEVAAAEPEGIFDELEDLATQAARTSEDNFCCHDNIDSECPLQPMLSELESEHYLELNDLSFFEENDPYGLSIPNDLSAQYPLEFQPIFQMENPNFIADTANTTTSMVGSSAPLMPNAADDQIT